MPNDRCQLLRELGSTVRFASGINQPNARLTAINATTSQCRNLATGEYVVVRMRYTSKVCPRYGDRRRIE